MNKFFPLLLINLICLTSRAQPNIIVQTKGDAGNSNMAILKLSFGSFPIAVDSVYPKNNKYHFLLSDSIWSLQPTFATIIFKDKENRTWPLTFENYIEPGNKETAFYLADTIISFTGSFNPVKQFVISRYPEGDVFFSKQVKRVFSSRDTSDEKFQNLLKFIKLYPGSRYLQTKVWDFRRSYSATQLEAILTAFSPDILYTEPGSKLKIFAENKLAEENHSEYTNLTLLDKNGKNVKIFDKLKAANLIVFWTSWCHPCRGEIPLIKKIYTDLKAQNADFQITYVSVDSKKQAWLEADKAENLPWRSLWTDNEKTVANAYNYSLPSNFLVTKDKRIHRIDVRDQEGIDALYKALGLKSGKIETAALQD
ncbi:MAG: TlpA family protein disulfide reductase [Niabella sp.]